MTRSLGFNQLIQLFDQTHSELQQRAARRVDTFLVIRNWLFGWYIVEFEQGGSDRAEYGNRLIRELSRALGERGLKGVSSTNLKQFRTFYLSRKSIGPAAGELSLPEVQKGQSAPDLFPALPEAIRTDLSLICDTLSDNFRLSWTHYVSLLTVDSPEERRFYEIEAEANGWSVRELERQIASSLYERLALSRDEGEIRRLAQKGQVVEKAADLIKNPLVLEFLGLEEKSSYSETDLESAIIDRLEQFLLELGKGFLFEARQKRFTFDNDHFYVDLVFYNRLPSKQALKDELERITDEIEGRPQR